MAKTRQQKEEIIKDLSEKIQKAKSLVFVNFDGLKVKEVEDLRKNCRAENVEYLVAKKTLMKKAFKEANLPEMQFDFEKEIAITLGYEDEIAPAKIVDKFSKSHETIEACGGFLEGQFIAKEQVVALAKLPSKNELLSKVVGSIKAPVSGFVNVLSGNLRNLVYVLNAIKDSKN